MPSRLGQRLEGIERLARPDRVDVIHAAGVFPIAVLGADARIIEAGRNRVDVERLSVVVLQARSCSCRAARLWRRTTACWRVLPEPDPRPPASTPVSATVFVVDEWIKHAGRVRPAADAGDDFVRQSAQIVQALLPRFAADHGLEVADDHREGMRADDGAQDVVRVGHRGHPVAHGFVDRVAQRAGAGGDRAHLGSQHPHVEDVEPLAADVFLAHVDDTVEPESGTGRGGGDAVLPGPRLGDDPLLAHAQGQQPLADGVVDFVRAGVVEVLALEIDAGAAALLR